MLINSTDYDVIVCGGGTSGVAAAIASARTGAKTLLIERVGALGGQLNVSGPPGFAFAHLFNPQGEQDAAGIIEEMHKRLLDAGHALPHIRPAFRARSGYTFSYVDPEWFGLMVFDMMEENNVTLLLYSLVVDVIKDGNAVKGVIVENANGRVAFNAKVVIDCTGEGDIAIKAGAPWEYVDRETVQPHSLCFTADGVDWDKVLKYIKENPDQIESAQLMNPAMNVTREEVIEGMVNIKDITELGEVMGFFKFKEHGLETGEWHRYAGVGFFLTPREGGKVQAHFQHSAQVPGCLTNDAWDLTRCAIECRKQIQIAWKFFKKYIPGFENAYITRIPTELRLREGARVMGDYYFTTEDVGAARKFEDVIGKSHFKAGAHHTADINTLAPNTKKVAPAGGGSYDIPYRCLVPKNVENLLVGGKAVSTDRDAYLRYLQQTMVTGQAAGVAAGLCVKKNITPRELEKDVTELQNILIKQGAVLYGTH